MKLISISSCPHFLVSLIFCFFHYVATLVSKLKEIFLQSSINTLSKNKKLINLLSCFFSILLQLNFAFMPMWARIPWVAGTSLVWTCILSAMRGGAVTEGETMVGGAVTGATMQIFQEGLQDAFSCPIEMDPNLSHFCVSASGKDQVGWGKLLFPLIKNVNYFFVFRKSTSFLITCYF